MAAVSRKLLWEHPAVLRPFPGPRLVDRMSWILKCQHSDKEASREVMVEAGEQHRVFGVCICGC